MIDGGMIGSKGWISRLIKSSVEVVDMVVLILDALDDTTPDDDASDDADVPLNGNRGSSPIYITKCVSE